MSENKQRYICNCDPIQAQKLGDIYVYPRQKILDLPLWSKARKLRLQKLNPANVCIDGCIIEAIEYIWSVGIETTGCCCGHGIEKAWVSVHPDDYPCMFELGYEQKPVEVKSGYPMGLYTFYL